LRINVVDAQRFRNGVNISAWDARPAAGFAVPMGLVAVFFVMFMRLIVCGFVMLLLVRRVDHGFRE
jgi:hypothetical protein